MPCREKDYLILVDMAAKVYIFDVNNMDHTLHEFELFPIFFINLLINK